MTETDIYEIELRGCTEEPLINYLKALGIFRIVHKQKDRSVKGYWKNGYFCLKTILSPEVLETFILEEFRPSPFFTPWLKDSECWGNPGNKGLKIIEYFSNSNDPRFEDIVNSFEAIQCINKEKGYLEKRKEEEEKKKEAKKNNEDKSGKKKGKTTAEKIDMVNHLIELKSNEQVADIVDLIYAISSDKRYNPLPLLGNGGNEARGLYSASFLSCMDKLFGSKSTPLRRKQLLSDSLSLSSEVDLEDKITCCLFDPKSIESGANLTNPWDLIFALEGCRLFRGSVTKKLDEATDASFPFTVKPSFSDSGHISMNKSSELRSEFWLPIWKSKSSFQELEYIFSESKANFKEYEVKNGIDFRLAISSFGVDRGIDSFIRYGRFERNGKASIAIPIGKHDVKSIRDIDLISNFYSWLDKLRKESSNEKSSKKYSLHLRKVEDSIFRFSKYGGVKNLQGVLIELGRAELSFSVTGSSAMSPLQTLSPEWIRACDDGSSEYRIACSLASIYNKDIGHIREQIESVKYDKGRYEWSKRKAVVSNHTDLPSSLIQILKRRLLEQNKSGSGNPLRANIRVNTSDLIKFLEGRVDDEKIWALFVALSTINWKDFEWEKHSPQKCEDNCSPILGKHFNSYALLKLCFPDGPYDIVDGRLQVQRNTNKQKNCLLIKTNTEILSLYVTKPEKAIEIATRRLTIHGFIPLGTKRYNGKSIDFEMKKDASERILAAVLIPIFDYHALASAVLRDNLDEISTRTFENDVSEE